MSEALAKWMSFIITANIMFAPILGYIDSLHREAVEIVLHEGAKKAAIEGRFTDEIINDMKQELISHYNFDGDNITITATKSLHYREEYIDASIEVPRGPIFILNIFNQGPSTIKKETRIMSEYLD